MNKPAPLDAPQEAPDSGSAAGHGAQRCGRIAIVGRPNVGKSTLLNAMVGQKVSITSSKAQTTRHRIMGVRTEPDGADGGVQYVFVDTPGFQTRHTGALNQTLNRTVRRTLSGVDLVLFVVQAGTFGPADARVLALLGPDTPVFLVANKLDLVRPRSALAPWLEDMQQHHPFAEFVPLSARRPGDARKLLKLCAAHLPVQPWWYDADTLTDHGERFMIRELVREKLFRNTGQELPYASTVVIDQMTEEPSKQHGRMLRVAATIVVQRASQKAIIIGANGERIKRIGSEARHELERLLACKMHLELWVDVRSGWADDEAHLRSYGYGDA